MIKPQRLFNFFKKKKIDFFTGVPDSILKELSPILEKKNNHVIVPNEGSAVGIASGYFLSTRKIPCVYLQNSGLGNAINPQVLDYFDNSKSNVNLKVDLKVPLNVIFDGNLAGGNRSAGSGGMKRRGQHSGAFRS